MKLKLVAALLLLSSPAFAAKLVWDANTETDIKGYKMYIGSASRQYTKTVDLGNVLEYPLTGLTPKTAYFFSVTAYNTTGLESDYSIELKFTPIAPPGNFRAIPTAPNVVADATVGDSSVGKFDPHSEELWTAKIDGFRIQGRKLASIK